LESRKNVNKPSVRQPPWLEKNKGRSDLAGKNFTPAVKLWRGNSAAAPQRKRGAGSIAPGNPWGKSGLTFNWNKVNWKTSRKDHPESFINRMTEESDHRTLSWKKGGRGGVASEKKTAKNPEF